MKILVTSDTHLSEKIWKHRPIDGDSYHSWRQIVDLAIDNNCESVILAGDILDKQTNMSRPIQELIEGLRKLGEQSIDVYFNQGQHEYQDSPWMNLDTNVDWLQETTIEVQSNRKWAITGSDYKSSDDLMAFLQSEKATTADILVCHQVWLEFMGEECKPQGSFADVPENVSYLITGDYHEHALKEFGHLTVLSPGSTHLRSISEPEDKFVFLMELPNDGNKAKITSLPLATRRRFEIKLTQNPDLKELNEQIDYYMQVADKYASDHDLPEELQKPLVRIVFPQTAVEGCNHAIKQLKGRAHLFFKQVKYVTAESLEPDLLQFTDASERVGMLACLDNYIDRKKKPEEHGLALKLLEAPDPEQALSQWVAEKLND